MKRQVKDDVWTIWLILDFLPFLHEKAVYLEDHDASDDLHLKNDLRVVEDARVLHHIHTVELFDPRIGERFGRNFAVDVSLKPTKRILWFNNILLFEVNLLISMIVILLSQVNGKLHAVDGDHLLSIDKPPLGGLLGL